MQTFLWISKESNLEEKFIDFELVFNSQINYFLFAYFKSFI